jgi:hypothetical protein
MIFSTKAKNRRREGAARDNEPAELAIWNIP